MRAALTTCVVWCCLISLANAQEWAKKMFTVTSHEFGTVAQGAKTDFRFGIKNIYVEDVVITGVSSSCGCTTPTLVQRGESAKQDSLVLKTYEVGEVLATFNTHIMTGQRSATLTVNIAKPFYAQVQLTVRGNIITDISVSPNHVDLSTVTQGETIEKSVIVTRSGRRDWKINDIRCANTNFEVEVLEKQRTLSSAAYELKVRLKPDAPAGAINDQLVLITNDDRMPQFPIQVQGEVRPELSITPSTWMAGALAPGEATERKIIVKNNNGKSFKITNIISDDDSIKFDSIDPNAGARKLHVLPIKVIAGNEPGRQLKKLKIETDLGTMTPELTVNYLVKGTVPANQNLTGNSTTTPPATNKTEVNTAKPSTGTTSQITPTSTTSSVLYGKVAELAPPAPQTNVTQKPAIKEITQTAETGTNQTTAASNPTVVNKPANSVPPQANNPNSSRRSIFRRP